MMGVILVTCLSPTLGIKLQERGNMPAIVALAFLKLSLELTDNKHLKHLLINKIMPSSMFIKTPFT